MSNTRTEPAYEELAQQLNSSAVISEPFKRRILALTAKACEEAFQLGVERGRHLGPRGQISRVRIGGGR